MARAGRGRSAKRAMVAMSFPCRTSLGRDAVSCGVDIHVAQLAAGYVTEAGSSRQQGRTPAGRRSAAPTRSASKISRSTLATASAVGDGKGRLTTSTEVSRKAKTRKHQAGCQGGRQGSSHCHELRWRLAQASARRQRSRAPATATRTCYGAVCQAAMPTPCGPVAGDAIRRIEGGRLIHFRPRNRQE